MDFLFALLAEPVRAFTDAAQSRAHIAQLFGIAIDFRDGERTFGSALNFIHLIGARVNGDAVALADTSF